MTKTKRVHLIERLLKIFFPTAKKANLKKQVENWENEGGAIDKPKTSKNK